METIRTQEKGTQKLSAESGTGLAEQIAEMRGVLTQLVERFNHFERSMEGRLDRIDSRIDRVEERIDRVDERIDRNFLWTMGVVLTTWITLLVTILVKL